MSLQNTAGTQVGDKVRIRSGDHAGERGLIDEVADASVLVRFDTGEQVLMPLDNITNYSLAARRAWESMPKRAGRPVSVGAQKKMVSIRLNSEVWELLGKAVDLGLIRSREHAINAWLRERVNCVLGREDDS